MDSEEFSAEIGNFAAPSTIGRPRTDAPAPFETPSQLRIACSTYNVHSSSITCDLTPWISRHFTVQERPPPDIVVIGMQEITMAPRSLITEETQEGCDWGALLLRDVNACAARAGHGVRNGSPISYLCLVSRQLVGMSIYVFVSNVAHTFISSATTSSLPLGALSMFGNKGAVEARLLIGSFSLQFINCHLIPHPPNLAKRNLQVQAIFAHFPPADFTLFMGDMNYRVDLDSTHVRNLAAGGKYSDILSQCQMMKVMQQPDNPLSGFSEAPIHFAPSYSYDVGTDNFDSSPKLRIPSYCDRILWRCVDRSVSSCITCRCSYYDMAPICASDHKPVVAHLQLSMTHNDADTRSSFSVSPITPMNIGSHTRMNLASSDADIDRRRLMLARASLRVSDGTYDNTIMPRPLSSSVNLGVWRGSQLPNLVSRQQDGRWALDESSSACNRCSGAFSALRRRHHCRWCGCLLCSDCARSKRQLPPSDFGGIHAHYSTPQSVCPMCVDHLDKNTLLPAETLGQA